MSPHVKKVISPSKRSFAPLHLNQLLSMTKFTIKKIYLKILKWPQHFGLFLSESNRICAILLQDLISLIFTNVWWKCFERGDGKGPVESPSWSRWRLRSMQEGECERCDGWLCMSLHIGYPSKPTIVSSMLEGRFNTISIP